MGERGRFALFAGDNYYPEGGWDDFRGWFASLDEAIVAGVERAQRVGFDGQPLGWWHVVDIEAAAQVAQGHWRYKDRWLTPDDEAWPGN